MDKQKIRRLLRLKKRLEELKEEYEGRLINQCQHM